MLLGGNISSKYNLWTTVGLNNKPYYIDTSVLLENIPLVKFIKTTSGPEWFIFHNLTREFIDDVILVISLYYFIDVFLSI